MTIKCPQCQFENPDDTIYCGKCASPLKPSEEIAVTETIETHKEELTTGSTFAGRYQIIEELGKGGMGKVYKVHDTKIKDKIALKLIKPEIAKDKKTIERFSNELRLTRKIRHKNICQMFDLGEERGTHFITMEFVEGQDLKKLIRQTGQLAIGTTINVAKQVCDGLVEAHTSGVVHRDLKPNNIMIDADGNARIMDFGIARSLETRGITDAGVMIGTPEYMSPEQVEGKEVDQRSDIYSLGVILYEMVTGRVPFEGETSLSIAMKHKSEEPPDPKDLNDQISEGFSQVILRCMKKDKEKRYQDAEELLSQLNNLEKGISTTGRIFSEQKPTAETTSEIRWKNSIAVLPFVDLSSQRDQEYFCDGMTDEIILKLSKLADLKVISRTSVMRYKNTEKDIREIGQELGVATIMEGSIRKEENNIRISAQLINVEDGFHLWSDKYDRKLERIFEVQEDVSRSIADALMREKLTVDSLDTAIKTNRPSKIEAYDYCLRGWYFTNSKYAISFKEADFQTALKMFRRALEIDPNYAYAYCGMGFAYQNHYTITRNEEDLDLVIKNCKKSYELEPNLVCSNTALAWVYYVKGDYDKAYKSYKKAISINSNISSVIYLIARLFRQVGLFRKAIKHCSRATELDPFYHYYYSLLARCFMDIGELEKAEISIGKAYEVEPDSIWVILDKSLLLIKMRKYNEAEELLTKAERLHPRFSTIQNYKSLVFAAKGEKDKALAIRKNGAVYSLLGMKDEAIQYIEDEMKKDYEHHDCSYISLLNSPFYYSLRDDTRFQEILKKAKQKYEERLNKFGDL
ncbi:MAG: protein kinase [Nitrospirota bacterium]|nr:protein kinase [Candidatus Aminicenantes bacterium]MDH5202879.1 protein kinase [Nitrospirota bacterium]